MHQWYVHGLEWTQKQGFVYPNEFITWSIQIVMYPFLTGLVAGAFVLSSLYHLFGVKELKDMAKFALVFSFALLLGAPIPLMLHLQQPLRGVEIYMTPHFTSAISAFGIVYLTYALIVCSEIWFLYRAFFVGRATELSKKEGLGSLALRNIYRVLTLGANDVSPKAIEADHKAIKFLAGIGVPAACFLHGYAGFIFGSVKANALWMTPLMPVIFIMSAIISGIALCMFTYTIVMEWKKHVTKKRLAMHLRTGETLQDLRGTELEMIRISAKYLMAFMIAAFSLELLDLIFRGYTAVKSWDILRSVIYQRDWVDIFIKQYLCGYVIPFALLLWPGLTVRRAVLATVLVLFGVYMMRWNVVIGGQEFSLTFAGFMNYNIPIIPHNWQTYKEGVFGAITVGLLPFFFFYFINKLIPSFPPVHHEGKTK
ncbi:MAG: polysulfide reductase NrfD [Nitrospiraceae bacterium]|nr:polysulfide reductase NrfD [Nitrospiraceae bacterium]